MTAKEKQKRYRERKKRQEFFGNTFCVTRCQLEAEQAGIGAEWGEIMRESYDKLGPEATRRFSTLAFSYLSLVNLWHQEKERMI